MKSENSPERYLIEAESFEDLGGWVIETQSMPHMGSAYIMAHGLGVPVKDAVTGIRINKTAVYGIWVRTRNWTAIWHRGQPAGRFTLSVNGTALPAILGTNGEDWSWQFAGKAELPSPLSSQVQVPCRFPSRVRRFLSRGANRKRARDTGKQLRRKLRQKLRQKLRRKQPQKLSV